MADARKIVENDEHERPEDMVENPGLAEEAARSLEDAADSHARLEGYYAMNNEPKEAAEDISAEIEENRGPHGANKKEKAAGS